MRQIKHALTWQLGPGKEDFIAHASVHMCAFQSSFTGNFIVTDRQNLLTLMGEKPL